MFVSWFAKVKMMKAYVAGDLDSAIEYANKSLSRNDKDVASLWTLAECSRLQGNNADAILYGERSYSVDPKHIDTLQLPSEVYFDQQDYKSAYEYACRAISVSEELDASLRPYIEKIKAGLSSSNSVPRPVREAMTNEEKTTQAWVAWALKFKTWYEASQHPDRGSEAH